MLKCALFKIIQQYQVKSKTQLLNRGPVLSTATVKHIGAVKFLLNSLNTEEKADNESTHDFISRISFWRKISCNGLVLSKFSDSGSSSFVTVASFVFIRTVTAKLSSSSFLTARFAGVGSTMGTQVDPEAKLAESGSKLMFDCPQSLSTKTCTNSKRRNGVGAGQSKF
uniref:Uncharacterized protein n=1 Tax=Romanomermis culicivorax TaxID=13658 RepID=A0A915IH88_ROMCU